jgi:hypothetical protein
VVASWSADEPHVIARLEREQPPSIDLLLEDPAVAVKRTIHERRLRELDLREVQATSVPDASRCKLRGPMAQADPEYAMARRLE